MPTAVATVIPGLLEPEDRLELGLVAARAGAGDHVAEGVQVRLRLRVVGIGLRSARLRQREDGVEVEEEVRPQRGDLVVCRREDRRVRQGLSRRQARLGGPGAVADHELVALLRDLHGPWDAGIAELQAGATAAQAQGLGGAAELQEGLELCEETVGQARILGLDDQGARERGLRRALHVDDGVAERARELIDRRSGGALNLLDGGVEVRDLVLQLVEALLGDVTQIGYSEGEPSLPRHIADERAFGCLHALVATGRLELDRVRRGRERARDGLVEVLARALLDRGLAGRVDLIAAQRVDEVLGDRVERPEAVLRQVADRILEVARVAERVPLVRIDRRLEARQVTLDEEVADGPEDRTRLALVLLVGGAVVGLGGRVRGRVAGGLLSEGDRGRRIGRLDDCRSLGVLPERGEEDAGLLAEPGCDVLLEVDRVPVRLGLVLQQRDDLGSRVTGVEDLAEGRLGVGLRRAGRLDRRVEVDRRVRRDRGRGADVRAAAPTATTAGQDGGRDGDTGEQGCDAAATHEGEKLHQSGRADARPRLYSTVTVFARLRGWSTFRPFS